MKRKGISPLIAAVLLIAFTMAIASIFAQWAPQLIESTQDSVDNQEDNVLACNNIRLDIISSDASSASVQLVSGDTLGDRNVSVTWTYSDGSDPVQVSNETISSPQGIVNYDLSDYSDKSPGSELDSVEAAATGC